MSDSNFNLVKTPDEITTDPLTTMLRNGAQALIAKAVETELETLLTAHEHIRQKWTPKMRQWCRIETIVFGIKNGSQKVQF